MPVLPEQELPEWVPLAQRLRELRPALAVWAAVAPVVGRRCANFVNVLSAT